MASEFTINSQSIETKINQLLPSQAGFGAGVDFSASTMVIPIVDLTESAEGSGLRQDLQLAVSHGSATTFAVSDATTTVITTTGYYRITACATASTRTNQDAVQIILNDGTSDKVVWQLRNPINSAERPISENIDLIVFLPAGNSLKLKTSTNVSHISGSVRQVADVNGDLTNPI
jgi:hypothetical protein